MSAVANVLPLMMRMSWPITQLVYGSSTCRGRVAKVGRVARVGRLGRGAVRRGGRVDVVGVGWQVDGGWVSE